MNLYLVVEGEQTEMQLYPKWIEYYLPQLLRVNNSHKKVVSNNYFIISGGGIPSIYKHACDAIKNINSHPVFDYLVVIMDGEDAGTERRKQKLLNEIEKRELTLSTNCELKIIVQNPCIETWFLGNPNFVPRKANTNIEGLKPYLDFYNVIEYDPELMDKMPTCATKAQFHTKYFREVFKERMRGESYKKDKPKHVFEKIYLQQLKCRVEETKHLPSLAELLFFLQKIAR